MSDGVRPRVAVLIPCYNEQATIGKTVADFRRLLPDAAIYAYDNASTDATSQVAQQAGAHVRFEARKGKGNVVRRMFRDIDADWYVMVDGDDTYEAEAVTTMLARAASGPYDLVNAIRRDTEQAAYRQGHRMGNVLLTGMVQQVFGQGIQDMLSGFKVFSRRFVKTFPAMSGGFDIETEIAIHALELSMPVAHESCDYRGRPEGSESKLRTWQDGWRILKLILRLLRHERPLYFFMGLSLSGMLVAMLLAWPVLDTWLQTGLVPRLPTAVLATGIMLSSLLSLATGLVLDTVTQGRREVRTLAYLAEPAPPVVMP